MRLARLRYASRKLILLFVLFAACAAWVPWAFCSARPKVFRRTHGICRPRSRYSGPVVVYCAYSLCPPLCSPVLPTVLGGKPSRATLQAQQNQATTISPLSFVIGMTSQVSDVQIESSEIRRWALLHGICLPFAFNAAVLHMGINVISGLF